MSIHTRLVAWTSTEDAYVEKKKSDKAKKKKKTI